MTEVDLLESIKNFFEDTSRSKEETIEGLQSALEDIQALIETLEE